MTGRGLVALVVLCGCSGSAPRSLPAASPAPESSARTVGSAVGVPSAPVVASSSGVDQSATAELEVARALKYVSALRELAPLAPVKGRVLSRDEMVGYVERDLDHETPPEVVRASGEILFALGTVPASFDYRKALLEVMRAELLGFYEPHEKTMFVGADLHGEELNSTLWHELVHALQDQHYGLEKLLAFADDASDWQGAVHALAEGDATSAMIDAMFAPKGGRAPDLPDSMMDLQNALSAGIVGQVPAIIKRSVVAPYTDGLMFVNALRRRGGWAAVDAAWRRLPSTTEQILHLEKYDANEGSEVLPKPEPPRPTMRATYSDIYGEESVRILFEEWMPARAAREAAADWAGDRVTSFGGDGAAAVTWSIRYDNDGAALRALRAFARGALAPEDQTVDVRGRLTDFVSAADAKRASDTGRVCRERHTRGPFAVIRSKRDLVVTLGPFRRNSGLAASDGDCTAAFRWAEAQLTQLKSRK
ncbi:MAG TPA: hypothetical protein VHV51_07895 [Polyangiaceae bacterium]|jgi:hypothetical protein|nr:hypothetical protein [Polyangiaceae bacterium]